MKFFMWGSMLVALISCKARDETILPKVQDITESVYASGIVKSSNQYQVFSTVNGIIGQIHIREGDLVQKNDRILTLVNETPRLNSENARLAADYASLPYNLDRLKDLEANISLARTKMQTDSLFLQRQRNLWTEEIGSRNELDQRELAWKNAATAYRSAILRYNDLKKQIDFSARQSKNSWQISNVLADDYTVRAKQNGKVYSLLKEPGEMVNTQTPVALIGAADAFVLELQVDEYDIARIRPGLSVYLTMDSYKDQVFEAVVDKIEPIMNDRTRSFTIDASFTTRPANLYPNLTVEANILVSAKKNALTIPRSYLVDENFVLLKNGEKRKVAIGIKDYERVEIRNGLDRETIIKKPLP
jgi:HlyD family secretion protein